MADAYHPSPFEIAQAEIDGWRGRCIDLFSRGEHAVGRALEQAIACGRAVKLRHLAGHRLSDLSAFAEASGGTAKQVQALREAIEAWTAIEADRVFLAHGTRTVLIDKHSAWFVLLEFTAYRGNAAEPRRRILTRLEAEQFEALLKERCADLSAQLGQLRKRLSA